MHHDLRTKTSKTSGAKINNWWGQKLWFYYTFNETMYVYECDLKYLENLQSKVPLGTLFIGRCSQIIDSAERKFVPWHLWPLNILMQSSNTYNAVLFADHEFAKASADGTHHVLKDARPVTLTSCSHKQVLLGNTCLVFLVIFPKENLRGSRAS